MTKLLVTGLYWYLFCILKSVNIIFLPDRTPVVAYLPVPGKGWEGAAGTWVSHHPLVSFSSLLPVSAKHTLAIRSPEPKLCSHL